MRDLHTGPLRWYARLPFGREVASRQVKADGDNGGARLPLPQGGGFFFAFGHRRLCRAVHTPPKPMVTRMRVRRHAGPSPGPPFGRSHGTATLAWAWTWKPSGAGWRVTTVGSERAKLTGESAAHHARSHFPDAVGVPRRRGRHARSLTCTRNASVWATWESHEATTQQPHASGSRQATTA
jgi:hypothetical protein